MIFLFSLTFGNVLKSFYLYEKGGSAHRNKVAEGFASRAVWPANFDRYFRVATGVLASISRVAGFQLHLRVGRVLPLFHISRYYLMSASGVTSNSRY